jgi:ABC-type sulfate/molybdate transport systems ATPase subunit
LSGGQQQRGELARALAREPGVLLLDEPFSALDGPTRLQIGQWLRELIQREQMAMVMASHDWSDVEAWADEVLLLDEGRVVGQGAPASLFLKPPNWSAARLLGYETRVEGRGLHPDLADFTAPYQCPVVVAGRVQAHTPHGAGVRVKLRTDGGVELSATVPRGVPVPGIGCRVEVGFHAPEVCDA